AAPCAPRKSATRQPSGAPIWLRASAARSSTSTAASTPPPWVTSKTDPGLPAPRKSRVRRGFFVPGGNKNARHGPGVFSIEARLLVALDLRFFLELLQVGRVILLATARGQETAIHGTLIVAQLDLRLVDPGQADQRVIATAQRHPGVGRLFGGGVARHAENLLEHGRIDTILATVRGLDHLPLPLDGLAFPQAGQQRLAFLASGFTGALGDQLGTDLLGHLVQRQQLGLVMVANPDHHLGIAVQLDQTAVTAAFQQLGARSEERRVGKEWRARWATERDEHTVRRSS